MNISEDELAITKNTLEKMWNNLHSICFDSVLEYWIDEDLHSIIKYKFIGSFIVDLLVVSRSLKFIVVVVCITNPELICYYQKRWRVQKCVTFVIIILFELFQNSSNQNVMIHLIIKLNHEILMNYCYYEIIVKEILSYIKNKTNVPDCFYLCNVRWYT